jgi:RNA polymerase primary sigma factor
LESLVRETTQNSLDAAVGNRVSTRFTLFDLPKKSTRYKQFVAGVDFLGLKKHLQAAVDSGGKRDIAVRIADGLTLAAADERPLRLLAVEDFGATGLKGDEFESGSAFAALVRDVSNSQKHDQTAGGSYGLGSQTLFGSSRIMTVLFASQIHGEEQRGIRLIGKAELSYHKIDRAEYAGRGWIGESIGDDGAQSTWEDPGSTLLKKLLLHRTPPAGETRTSGTTALIVAFSEADADDQDGEEVAERIVRTVARDFWPAVELGQLTTEVQYYSGDEDAPSVHKKVRPAEYVPSLVDAFAKYRKNELEDKLREPGDTVSEAVELTIPKTSAEGGVDPQHPQLTAECRVIIRLADPDAADAKLAEHVGFTRGRGMIVQYAPRRNLAAGARPYHAIVLAGTIAGAGPNEIAAEKFLRFSEPPAHDEWDGANLGSRYARGGGARLREFQEAIREVLRRFVCPDSTETTDGPEVLREIFRMRKLPAPPEPGIRISAAAAPFRDGVYHVQATVRPGKSGRVVVIPRLTIAKEQGSPIRLDWLDLSAEGAEVTENRLVIANSPASVKITGTARPEIPGLDPLRCVVRVTASYAAERDNA